MFPSGAFLPVVKPRGLSSRQAVTIVSHLLGREFKLGHTGTLDPMAEGVLPMALGQATKLIPFLPPRKSYLATVRFGVGTDTDDVEGAVIRTGSAADLSAEAIERVLQSRFVSRRRRSRRRGSGERDDAPGGARA